MLSNLPLVTVITQTRGRWGVTADFLMDGSMDDKAKAAISDKELLSQFQQVAKLSNERKAIVKELIEAFLLKTDLQEKLAH